MKTYEMTRADASWIRVRVRDNSEVLRPAVKARRCRLRRTMHYGIRAQCGGTTIVCTKDTLARMRERLKLLDELHERTGGGSYDSTVPWDRELFARMRKHDGRFAASVSFEGFGFDGKPGLYRVLCRKDTTPAVENELGEKLAKLGAVRFDTKGVSAWFYAINSKYEVNERIPGSAWQPDGVIVRPYSESRENLLQEVGISKKFSKEKLLQDVSTLLLRVEGAEIVTLTCNYIMSDPYKPMVTGLERMAAYLKPGDIPGLTDVHFCVGHNPRERCHDVCMINLVFKDGVPALDIRATEMLTALVAPVACDDVRVLPRVKTITNVRSAPIGTALGDAVQ